MANPFSVNILGGQNIAQGIQNLGEILRSNRAQQQQQEQAQQLQQLRVAAARGDQNAMQQLIGLGDMDTATKLQQQQQATQEKAEKDLMRQYFLLRDNPEQQQALIDEGLRINVLDEGDLRTINLMRGNQKNEQLIAAELFGNEQAKALLGSSPSFTGVDIDPDNNVITFYNKQTGDYESKPLQEFEPGNDMTPVQRREFWKEERSVANQTLSQLRKEASGVSEAWNKFNSVIEQAKKGSRSAIAAVTMSLARLQSPGVVTDADFRNTLGATDPFAAMIGYLQSGAVDTDALTRAYDPTNPDAFDADAAKELAGALIASSVPALQTRFGNIENRLNVAQVPDAQKRTILANKQYYSDLSNLVPQDTASKQPPPKVVLNHPTLGAIYEADIQNTMQQENMSREDVMRMLLQSAGGD